MPHLVWSLILLALAAVVIVFEMFIPSAGLLGVIATILVVSGIVLAFMHSVPAGAVVLLATVMAIPGLLMLLVKVWPSTPIGRRILLGPQTRDEVLPDDEHRRTLRELVGQRGVALTPMLPSGMVQLDGRSYDAVCEGFAVEPGQKIRVIAVRANRLYVQPYDPAEDLETDFSNDLLEKPLKDLGIEGFDSHRGKT
jgi:membrane-bound ClpP family serine protease